MMRLINTTIGILLVALVSLTVVHAMDLSAAKQQGLVGEQLNGYLGIVTSSPGTDVRALVNEINSARKQKYQEIAKENGTTLETVETLAGQKAIEKTQGGQYIQTPIGWKKK